MTFLLAICGFSGSGKTIATQYLAEQSKGERFYLGGKILTLVRERGLPETRESEQRVRIELRERDGMAALAKLEKNEVELVLNRGQAAIIDAVFSVEEYELFKSAAGPHKIILIGVNSSFEIRCRRLLARPLRPLTSEELEVRDKLERDVLGLSSLMSLADRIIDNENDLVSYHAQLDEILLLANS